MRPAKKAEFSLITAFFTSAVISVPLLFFGWLLGASGRTVEEAITAVLLGGGPLTLVLIPVVYGLVRGSRIAREAKAIADSTPPPDETRE